MVHKRYPFTIRLKDRKAEHSVFQSVQVKLDPGSKTTGMALVVQGNGRLIIKHLFHLVHRGHQISEALTQRKAFRRRRRNQLWYRPARFNNRIKPKGWLPPSLKHRVDTTLAWVDKLSRLTHEPEVYLERVKFDTQLINNPDIEGEGYQQGELKDFEVREYLRYKYKHTCQYCGGLSGDAVLEREHIHPRSKGGSNRIGNLTLSCRSCNQAKGALLLEDWKASLGHSKLALARKQGIERVLSGKCKTQRDMAAVNATRNSLFYKLLEKGFAVSTGTGGMTKFNRKQHGIPKDHALDAVCVGEPVEQPIFGWNKPIHEIKCTGRGSYQRTRLTKYGFPRGYLMRSKSVQGFATGDIVKADVPRGKKQGDYMGRVAVRASGSFNIQSKNGLVQGISHKHCTLIERGAGYGFKQLDSINMGSREKAVA
jgi:5-methylcytosine-specific restriction endonuclease McrA